MTERLNNSSTPQSELSRHSEEAEGSVGVIQFDAAELIRQGVRYSIANGGLDKKRGYQIMAGSESRSRE